MTLKKLYVATTILFTFLLVLSCSKPATPAIVEIIDSDRDVTSAGLKTIIDQNPSKNEIIFRWENHWAIYSDASQLSKLSKKIKTKFPNIKLNLYEKPFYNFNREKLTGEKPAKEWKHIIMTANLINDTTLQNEYMEYHRTQFENWPEISKGFINADFQQLLVFRNGRQLMLVISIPKGKTLDELNPKTTENNPRVDEWNKIMAKYQEGIEDAPQNTTWVMFRALR
jgi:L-rhamnose mutarotase